MFNAKNSQKDDVSKNETPKKVNKKTPFMSKFKQNKITNAKFIKKGSTNKNSPVLKVDKISKEFGDFKALDKITFKLERGERIGLIGANGAGKTTISEIIAGLSKPTSGTMTYGFEFEDSPQEKIGMQFQQSEYPSGLTVKDMIRFAINLRKLKIDKEELNELLDIFQMQDFYHRKARALSGGQRQKLNILMSIMHHPEIVILDELSTGLDIAAREDIIEFTDNLLTRRHMSAILISHHMQEIKTLCKKVVILDHGRVKKIALIEDIEKEHGSLNAYAKTLIHEGIEEINEENKEKEEQEELKEKKWTKVIGKLKFKKNASEVEKIVKVKDSKKNRIKKVKKDKKGDK